MFLLTAVLKVSSSIINSRFGNEGHSEFNISLNNSELMYDNRKFQSNQVAVPFDINHKSVTVDYYNSWYDNTSTREIFECYENFEFIPKKIIYNVIKWETILKASDVVFDAIMSQKDIIEIVSITTKMNKNQHVHDLSYYFKIFVTNFLTNQQTKVRLNPIGHLIEVLAYHSYDLIFDLSFYSTFEDYKEIKKIKKLVYGFIEVRIKESCPWHVTQLFSEEMYSTVKIKNIKEIPFAGSRG
ncbi:uncharacterized protein VNE69_11003 [Vairimorpha necatrix]|uniref:Uncharacterized protein n=1 Tax=Vairimorpha necatrix TaxID=6039 RepID=A0AAX4JFX5_9MICR